MGGNQRLNDFLIARGVDPSRPIREKYDNDIAELYKLQLKARVEDKPIPTTLPKSKTSATTDKPKSKYQGFGSSPPARPRAYSRGSLSQAKLILVSIVVVLGAWLVSRANTVNARLSTAYVRRFYDFTGSHLDMMAIFEDKPRHAALNAMDLTDKRILNRVWHWSYGPKDPREQGASG